MSGLSNMEKRMIYDGGKTRDSRIIRSKYLSFKGALTNSYQAEDIIFNEKKCRCLINPDKLTNDYDQKEISIDFKSGMEAGSVFYWPRTNSHWISYLRHFEEEAYYRARIRRCDYSIEIEEEPYWVYLRGPVETAIVWRQKHQIEFNELNYSIILYITKNDKTNKFFHRHQIVKFDGHNWRVDAVDRYSTPGILEVNLGEYNDTEFEETNTDNITPITKDPHIVVPKEVYGLDTKVEISIAGYVDPHGWFYIPNVDKNKVEIVESNSKDCLVNILSSKAGSFTIKYRQSNSDEPISAVVNIKSL